MLAFVLRLVPDKWSAMTFDLLENRLVREDQPVLSLARMVSSLSLGGAHGVAFFLMSFKESFMIA